MPATVTSLAPRRQAAVTGVITVLGIDPGDTVGLCLVTWRRPCVVAESVRAFQCDRGAAPGMCAMLLNAHPRLITCAGMEAFRSGTRSARLKGTHADHTRDLIILLAGLLRQHGVVPVTRPAATVKTWATDARLDAAGLLAATAGQRHARDAARHAAYTACRDAGLPDPLSRPGQAGPR